MKVRKGLSGRESEGERRCDLEKKYEVETGKKSKKKKKRGGG